MVTQWYLTSPAHMNMDYEVLLCDIAKNISPPKNTFLINVSYYSQSLGDCKVYFLLFAQS